MRDAVREKETGRAGEGGRKEGRGGERKTSQPVYTINICNAKKLLDVRTVEMNSGVLCSLVL